MDKVKEAFSKTFTTVKEKWTGYAAKTRIIILAVAGVIVVSAIVMTAVLNATSDVMLTRTNGPDEVNEILGVLATAGITDVRVNSNSEVFVKDNVLGVARVAITEAGLPRPGFNNDTWNNGIGMFTTDSQLNETRKHQLQDNIMAHLTNIPEVERSNVILHIPKTSNFVMRENREESSASVGVTLKTGQTLSNAQITGIYYYVMNAVPGLLEHNITVTDGNGVVLVPNDTTEDSGATLALEQQRLNMEAGILAMMADAAEARLNPLLAAAWGEAGVGYEIAVFVDVEFSDEKDVLVEEFTPSEGLDGGIIRDIKEKAAAGGIALDGGPIGTFGNADIGPDYPTIPEIEAGGEFYYEWGRDIYYEINRRLETYKDTGLRIRNRTAALVVNSEPLTQAETDAWAEIVASAIGATDVAVVAKVFPLPTSPIEPGGPRFGDITRNILIYIIIALGVLLVILFVLAILTSGSKKQRLVRNRGAALVTDGLGGFVSEDTFQPLPPQDEGFELQSLLEENDTKDVVLKREIKEFSKSNPEIIAQLIRTWLREDEP